MFTRPAGRATLGGVVSGMYNVGTVPVVLRLTVQILEGRKFDSNCTTEGSGLAKAKKNRRMMAPSLCEVLHVKEPYLTMARAFDRSFMRHHILVHVPD